MLSRGTIVPTFHGRSCAAENHCAALLLRPQNGDITSVIARRFLLLVGALMLFIDDDDSKVFERRKDGASRPDDNARTAGMNLPPLIEAFASREMAVKNGDFRCASAKRALNLSTVCGVSEISGTRTSAVRPRSITCRIACK